MVPAWAVSSGVLVFFLCAYTAYDKAHKALRAPLLLDVLLARRGWLHAAVEVNKVLALAGLLLLPCAGLPPIVGFVSGGAPALLLHALVLLLLHSAFSAWHFGVTLDGVAAASRTLARQALRTSKGALAALRLASVLLGVGALVATVWAVWGAPALVTATALGVAHFISMEVDFAGRLQVRPAGYTALVPAVAVLAAALAAAFAP